MIRNIIYTLHNCLKDTQIMMGESSFPCGTPLSLLSLDMYSRPPRYANPQSVSFRSTAVNFCGYISQNNSNWEYAWCVSKRQRERTL